MPRRVVPIENRPSRISAAPSSSTWYGMIRCAALETRRPSTEIPRSSRASSSLHSTPGSTTVPLPMMQSLPG